MSENDRGIEELTPKQMQAIAALLSQPTIEKAAEAAKVAPKTLYRWMEDVAFVTRLRASEGALIDGVVRRLIGLHTEAVDLISEVMRNREASDTVRLRAAGMALDTLVKFRELRNVEERLAMMEDAMEWVRKAHEQ